GSESHALDFDSYLLLRLTSSASLGSLAEIEVPARSGPGSRPVLVRTADEGNLVVVDDDGADTDAWVRGHPRSPSTRYGSSSWRASPPTPTGSFCPSKLADASGRASLASSRASCPS